MGVGSLAKMLAARMAGNRFLGAVMSKLSSYGRKRRYVEEFYSRISRVNVEEYIDVSQKPCLNVVVIVVDCLRYLNMSFAGYRRETTPFMDSLRARFKAVAPAPWTYPSVASILTGLYPHNHGAFLHSRIRNFDDVRSFRGIAEDVLTLPEILFLLGYEIYFATSISVASYPLRGRVVPRHYTQRTPAGRLIDDLKRWVKRRRGPFFAYLHLGDLHEPLNPPKGFRDFFGRVEGLLRIEGWDYRRPLEQRGERFERYKRKRYKRNRMLLYDNTLRYVDHSIQEFHYFLEKEGLLDSTILVITADHGEEFWEHAVLEAKHFYDPRGYYGVGHGHNLFNEVVEVPLLLDGAVERRRDPGRRVSLVDITPTVLDLLGVQHSLVFDGLNLFNTAKGRALISESTAYGYEKKALITGRHKLLHAPHDKVTWVFNLQEDPHEKNLITDRELSAKLTSMLNETIREGRRKMLKWRAKRITKTLLKTKPAR